MSEKSVFNTWPGLIFPGHQAIDGSLIPPSNVVSLPQRNGPLLPPKSKNVKFILVSGNPYKEIKHNIYRGSHISHSWFSCRSSILVIQMESGFCGARKTEDQGEKPFGERQEPTTNYICIFHWAIIKPGSHWWEASALNTAPSLLPTSNAYLMYTRSFL